MVLHRAGIRRVVRDDERLRRVCDLRRREFVDLRMFERAFLRRVSTARPGKARRVLYICDDMRVSRPRVG
jgi:hypothetical protein